MAYTRGKVKNRYYTSECGKYVTILVEPKISKVYAGQIFEYIVDTDQFEKVSKYSWCVRKQNGGLYCGGRVKNKAILLHQYLLDTYLIPNCRDADVYVDHIDGNIFDNRMANLQILTNRENVAKSRNYGAEWRNSKKCWRSRINLPRERNPIYLGSFNTEQEAKDQYKRACAIINTCTKDDLIALREKYKRKTVAPVPPGCKV